MATFAAVPKWHPGLKMFQNVTVYEHNSSAIISTLSPLWMPNGTRHFIPSKARQLFLFLNGEPLRGER